MSLPIYKIRIDKERREKLEEIAEVLGYRHGDKPSVPKLLRAIADGELILLKK
jgi:hypothetical protein